MSTLTTKPLAGTVGAEVVGLEPDQLLQDDSLPEAVMEALEDNGVLVFRELDIDDDTQVAFSQKLDDVGKSEPAKAPAIYIVSLDPQKSHTAEYTKGTFHWHIDGAQDDVPNKATVLSAIQVAATGGETEFASTYAAFDMLDPDEQEQALSTRVVHSLAATQRLTYPDPTPEQEAQWARVPDKVHPLVWTHRTGRRSLVIGATASHLEGMDVDEGRALLASLDERATAPERVYRHEWQVGDLVIWDNRGVMHRVCPYDASSAREMHRTTIAGDEAIR